MEGLSTCVVRDSASCIWFKPKEREKVKNKLTTSTEWTKQWLQSINLKGLYTNLLTELQNEEVAQHSLSIVNLLSFLSLYFRFTTFQKLSLVRRLSIKFSFFCILSISQPTLNLKEKLPSKTKRYRICYLVDSMTQCIYRTTRLPRQDCSIFQRRLINVEHVFSSIFKVHSSY